MLTLPLPTDLSPTAEPLPPLFLLLTISPPTRSPQPPSDPCPPRPTSPAPLHPRTLAQPRPPALSHALAHRWPPLALALVLALAGRDAPPGRHRRPLPRRLPHRCPPRTLGLCRRTRRARTFLPHALSPLSTPRPARARERASTHCTSCPAAVPPAPVTTLGAAHSRLWPHAPELPDARICAARDSPPREEARGNRLAGRRARDGGREDEWPRPWHWWAFSRSPPRRVLILIPSSFLRLAPRGARAHRWVVPAHERQGPAHLPPVRPSRALQGRQVRRKMGARARGPRCRV